MVYVALLVVSIALTFWLCAFSWLRRHAPGVADFSIMMLLGALWQAAVMLMLISPSQEMALFWYRASFVCVAAVPMFMLAFVARYTGSSFITTPRLIVLFVLPLITQVMVWSDDRYHLFFKTIDIAEKNGLMVIRSWTPGPWFIIHSSYSFFFLLAALAWLLVYAVRQFRVYRGQSTLFIIGALMVILPNLAFAAGFIPPDIILLPFCFLFMGMFFAWAIFRHKMFQVVPVARNMMVDIMSDGMIVLDTDNRVVDINPAAKDALDLADQDVIGSTAGHILSPWPELLERFSNMESAQTEISIQSGSDLLCYDVRITGLAHKADRPAGRLVLFRDITERKRIEREKDQLLEDLNRKNKELEVLYGMALDANPMTGLPGNNSVSAAIGRALKEGEPSCVIYTDLDNFKAFNDKYGFAHGDEVIRFTADLLKRSLAAVECGDSFIGHIGGDDFVLLVPSDKTAEVAEFIIREFNAGIVLFYHADDLARGFISAANRQGVREDFPIMSISMAGVDLAHRRYSGYIEVNDACAGLKKKSKSMPGSTFTLDMRGED